MQWFASRKIAIELMLIFFALIASVLYTTATMAYAQLLSALVLPLAIFYFLSTIYLPPDRGSLFTIIAFKVAGIGSAACVIGVLFTFLNMEGSKFQVLVGATSLIIPSIILAIDVLRSPRPENVLVVMRVLLLMSLGLYLFNSPLTK